MVEIRTGHGDSLVVTRHGYVEVGFRHLQRTVGANREFANIGEAVTANMRSMGCPEDIATRAGKRVQRQWDGLCQRTYPDLPAVEAARKIADDWNRERAAKFGALVAADKAAGLL